MCGILCEWKWNDSSHSQSPQWFLSPLVVPLFVRYDLLASAATQLSNFAFFLYNEFEIRKIFLPIFLHILIYHFDIYFGIMFRFTGEN